MGTLVGNRAHAEGARGREDVARMTLLSSKGPSKALVSRPPECSRDCSNEGISLPGRQSEIGA